ncbi:MAG: molybdenum cofactor guanylyltransferase [Thermodesulfovibrionia bacterium]|nr:MAG: molybdenum cofactor guanylyltransferase [Thermodesulfovibrionia bacterium]
MTGFLENCTGAILAGGENRRMPVLKSFIEINGEKIIERNLKIMQRLFKEILIITNQPEVYLYLGLPLFGDVYDVRGPMTGVLTSLLNASNQWVFISACDMPFINEHLIRDMATKRDNNFAVVPKSPLPSLAKGSGLSGRLGQKEDYIEPLFAFYSKKLIPYMEKAVVSGKTGLKNIFFNKRVKYITEEEIKNIDPDARSFINFNTPEDVSSILHIKES